MNKLNVSTMFARVSTVVLSLAALTLALPAKAQTGTLKVDVPFSFESGDTHFQAGQYRLHLNSGTSLIRIEGDKSSAFQMAIPDGSSRPAETSKVVFRRYGSRYVLKEIWVAGSTSHVRTRESKTEKDLELAEAQRNTQGTLALLAAK